MHRGIAWWPRFVLIFVFETVLAERKKLCVGCIFYKKFFNQKKFNHLRINKELVLKLEAMIIVACIGVLIQEKT